MLAGPTAVVIGASGGVGAALVRLLTARGDAVLALSRSSTPPVDLADEATIAAAADAAGTDLALVVDATGFLHNAHFRPEKSWRELSAEHLAYSYLVNAVGPALLMKHFLPRLARGTRAVFATLSARVGSIEDNRAGGWYSYRASKAALNQLVRTAAVELSRTNREAVCIALHPGTVATPLSAPFAKTGLEVREPDQAAALLLGVLDRVTATSSGRLLDYRGEVIPF